MISANGHKLPYVELTLSVTHLHVVHYNNINTMTLGNFGYVNSNINIIFQTVSTHNTYSNK